MSAGGADEHGHADFLAQHGGGQVAVVDVAEKAGADGQVFKGGAVAAGGEFVHGPGFDKGPVVVGQRDFGSGLVVVEIDWVHLLTLLFD